MLALSGIAVIDSSVYSLTVYKSVTSIHFYTLYQLHGAAAGQMLNGFIEGFMLMNARQERWKKHRASVPFYKFGVDY